jgi:hypothetical protein
VLAAAAARRRNPQVRHAFSHVVNALFSATGDTIAAGQIDTERIEAATPASLRRQLVMWRDENGLSGDWHCCVGGSGRAGDW